MRGDFYCRPGDYMGNLGTPDSPGDSLGLWDVSGTSRDVGVLSLLVAVASSLASYFRTKRAASSSSSSWKGTEQEQRELQSQASCGRARPHTRSNLGDSVTRGHGWQKGKAKTTLKIGQIGVVSGLSTRFC